MKRFWGSNYSIAFLFILIIFLRLYNLNADPSFTKRVSDISDEAMWGLDARVLAQFNHWPVGDIHFGLDSAPLYTYLMKINFEYFGASLFTLRLLSAISGSLIAIFLFLFVKRVTDKKQAALALALYGLGEAPLIYNRIGHIESTLTLFLLLMFILWQSAKENRWLYFLSGLCYSLAFLIKFTALFFAPAILAYWLYEYYQKRWGWKKFLYFAIGAIIPIAAYLFTFLIPNWDQLAKSMIAHGNNNFFGAEVLHNALRVLGNNIFGLPSVMILFTLLLIYLIYKLPFLPKFTIQEITNNLTPLEAISLCWIFAGTLGILLSDVSDRRFTIMFVPVIILISHLIINFKDISLKEVIAKISASEFRPAFMSGILYFLALLLPLFSFPYFQIRLLGGGSPLFRIVMIVILLSYFLAAIILYFADKKIISPETRFKLHKLLLFQFLFFAFLDPFTVLIRHFTRHISIVFSLLRSEKIILAASMLFFLLIFAVITFLLYKKDTIYLKRKHGTAVILLYFIIGAILITKIIFFPNYTVLNATQKIVQVTEPGNLIFGEAVENTYGTELQYMYYLPYHDNFGDLNKNLFSLKPKYYIYPKVFDGQPDYPENQKILFEDLKSKYQLKLLTTIDLYKYPFSDKYKVKLEVYKITYSK